MRLTASGGHTRADNLHGILQKKLSSLIKIERIKGGSGNGHSIEIRRLDCQRGARRRRGDRHRVRVE